MYSKYTIRYKYKIKTQINSYTYDKFCIQKNNSIEKINRKMTQRII